jgi:serine phosphatase RsbU (regulator of sigma subunit)
MQATGVADAIETLDRYAGHVPGAACATVCVALLDPAAGTVTYASAGHPPPLLVTPDGVASFLEGGRSWPLGIDRSSVPHPRPPAAVEQLPAGSLLLLYTDGLVERRDEDLDAGVDRLTAVVRHSVAEDRDHLHTFLERVARRVRRVGPARHDDDVAMLAVRRCE